MLIALVAWFSPALRDRRQFLAALAPCSADLMLISQLKLTVGGYRYGQAGMAAVLLFFLPIAGRCLQTRFMSVGLTCLMAVALVVMALSKTTEQPWIANGWIAELVLEPGYYGRSKLQDEDRMQQLRTMQAAVPPGEPMLAVMFWSSLLDFRRNPIAVMDWPGEMSPIGLPRADDGAARSRYLVGLGFHHVFLC